jgi:hypothetical protein
VLTVHDAARLLSGGDAASTLGAIGAALGFGETRRIGRTAAARLGFAAGADRPRIAAAGGALRALLIREHDRPLTRELVGARGRAIAHAYPDELWLLLAQDAHDGTLGIAALPPAGRGRIAALVADPAHVRDSDAETLAALADCRDESDLLVHLRWRETLGREALSRRFYRELEQCVSTLAVTADGRADAADRRTLALLQVSRLLFLAFLEAKGWLDRDRAFLRRGLERFGGGRGVHRRMLEPLFFGTLNTPPSRRAPAARAFGRVPFLNGGLFTRTPLESRHRQLRFTDDALGDVIGGLLGRYRLTARETSTEWSDAAVDPEMLGRAFESLMGDASRRAKGAFYTPQPLIERLTAQAIDLALGEALVAEAGDGPSSGPTGTPATGPLAALDRLRVLDPACGSGAFLVHALESLAERRACAGDARSLAARRRHVLAHAIFGVDVDPTAVWLCQLRLWLSVVVDDATEDPGRITPLPNLDRNIREGDALAGRAFGDAALPGDRALEPLRLRYARANGTRKRTLARALDRAERGRAVGAAEQLLARLTAERRDLLLALRARDLFRQRHAPDAAARTALVSLRNATRAARNALRRLRDGGALPFSFATHFPDAARDGGFDLVIGNPPWVRPHAVPAAARDALRARFFSFRCAAWEAGAGAAAAGRGFASQADLAALFTERAVELTRARGGIALLVPSKLWCALAGGGIRRYLARCAPPLAVEAWHDSTAGFDAAVYPSALIARRTAAAVRAPVVITAHHRAGARSWPVAREAFALDDSPGAPWLLLPPDVRAAFDRLSAAGTPLADSPLGRPVLGVKSGCNEAFIVRPDPAGAGPLVRVHSGTTDGLVERALLRPLVRGEHLRAWGVAADAATSAIIWTHDACDEPVSVLPREGARWLGRWRRRLELRSDGRGAAWWALFRTEAARGDRPRVVWGDIGRAPRAMVLEAGDPAVPLNTCYVVRAATPDDAHAFSALLNSRVAAAWLAVLAEPARGGYRRYLGWTCARLPIPRDWPAARERLAPLGRAGARGAAPDARDLDHAVLRAFGLGQADVAPLLAWLRS